MHWIKGEKIYEGKAKRLFALDNPEYVLIHYKDDATAFNGEKKSPVLGKGPLNNSISSLLFELVIKAGVPAHFVEKINDREQVCLKAEIVALVVNIRNVIAGSMAKHLGIEEGTEIPNTIFEICYKNDGLGDPLINDHHAVAMGLCTYEELEKIYAMTAKVNEIMTDFWDQQGIRLIDFKLEFGRTREGDIILADEISPDTCRLWEKGTNRKLDKDRFRRDLGGLEEAYKVIMAKLENS